MKISEIMTKDVLAVDASDGIPAALDRITQWRIRHLLVVERDRLVGVVTERDLLEATGWEPARAMDPAERRPRAIRDVMTVDPETADPDWDLAEAAARLADRKIGCLPVLAGQRIVGILTEADVVGAFVRAARSGALPRSLDPKIGERPAPDPVSVETRVSVVSALDRCRKNGIRHLPVVHEGWFVGLVSDRDLRLWIGRGRAHEVPVGDVMTKHVVTLGPAARLSEAAERMLENRIDCVPVVEQGKLLSLVTTHDVLAHCAAAPAALRSA